MGLHGPLSDAPRSASKLSMPPMAFCIESKSNRSDTKGCECERKWPKSVCTHWIDAGSGMASESSDEACWSPQEVMLEMR